MVDVGTKGVTRREATARAVVVFPPEAWAQLHAETGKDWIGPKGPITATAVVAGIQAVKRTSDLIPLCHPLPIEGVSITVSAVSEATLEVLCTVRTTHKTGVEMEALTGASVAALTLYDMTKALSHAIEIRSVTLVTKTGGKSDSGSLHGPA
ncbi:MAG: cyclic pyranopterin monophosphate synthase MoaC [Spirochaetales bacterium]|nr:cyclic pyranopterin monophosphate synthase MoaC [Spirochaetales bacterium]